MKKITNVTIGADPELFLINKETNEVVSSIGIIPGVKGNPYRSKSMPEGYGLEIDNILAEFNIPPAGDIVGFVHSIEYMKNFIRKYIKRKNKDLDIFHAASMLVPEDQLQSEEAKLFGCSVDYNAYTESANPKPKGETTNLRSAGFHIHIGYANNNIDTSVALIKYLDVFLGLPSVMIDPDTERRKLYGKAGAFRLTPYGVEYRVLSGYFIKDTVLTSWVYERVTDAIKAYNYDIALPDPDLVQDIINNSKKEEAEKLYTKYYNKI